MATGFTRAFLISDMKDMKAAFGTEQLVVQLTEFQVQACACQSAEVPQEGACNECCHLQALSCDGGLGLCLEV